jgi:type I restriction enzyme S subunit
MNNRISQDGVGTHALHSPNTNDLPSRWRVVRLAEVSKKAVLTDPRKQPNRPFIYVDVSSVSNESYQIIETKEIIGKDAPSRARKHIHTDDVIFATVRPTLRRVAMIPPELDSQVCSTGFCVLRANKEELEPAYAYFYLLTEWVTQQVQSLQKGVAYPAINDSDLFEQLILLPPLPEQRAITQALQTVQEAKTARQRELVFARERKVAFMQYLFTHGTGGEPRKQTEIGEIPESWRIVELGRVVDIIYGVQAAVAHLLDKSVGIPILTNINITNEGILDLSTLRYYTLPEQKREKLILKKGDLLFNWRSGSQYHVGKTALFDLDGEYTFSSFILRFRINEELINTYLFYYLTYIKMRGYFAQNRQQSSVNSVFNASVAATIPIAVPKLAEQHEIADVLQACDAKIAALEGEHSLLNE